MARLGEWKGFLFLAILVIALPLVTRSSYFLNMGVFIGLYALIATGLGLLLGYAGQVSLGHAAFYGLGAYSSAILTLHYGINPWLGLVAAAVITGLVAWLIGKPTLKLHGHYLAMATLGFGIICNILFGEGGAFTGGPSGLPGIPGLAIGSFEFNTDLRRYFLVWPLVVLQLVLMRNLLKSRLGRALRAIHDSELAASSCAIDPGKTKLMVFTLSAVWASLAGSLYAHTLNFVNPNPFGFVFSVTLVVMVVVGGSRSLWGPLLGVTAYSLLHEALTSGTMEQLMGAMGIPEDRLQSLVVVLFGLLLILMLQFRPKGLASFTRQKREAPDAG